MLEPRVVSALRPTICAVFYLVETFQQSHACLTDSLAQDEQLAKHVSIHAHTLNTNTHPTETIIDMQSWCRTWPPNGSRRIRAKQKLHRKHREACKSSWSQIGSLKSFTLTIPWNTAKPVKISPGIIARLHHTDQRQMVFLKERYAE